MSLLYEELSSEILGAAIKVHKKLGHGFLEKVYESALEYELLKSGHEVKRQEPIIVKYEEIIAGTYYADLVINGLIIIELKVTDMLTKANEAQLYNYLRATGYRLGLLINFAGNTVTVKRVIN